MSHDDDQDGIPGFIYRWDRDQALTQDRCFLCGADLADGRTDEHVFPQWLLRRCDLWNEKITLLNGTLMPYKQMRIPCCSTCNNEHLSRIEQAVGDAFAEGPEAVAALDTTTLFLWMGKVYYGLMFRELSLLADRRDPQGGSIVSPKFLATFRMHHLLMQAARGAVRWHNDQHPASVFVFEAQQPTDPRDRFDYVDVSCPFRACPPSSSSTPSTWAATHRSCPTSRVSRSRSSTTATTWSHSCETGKAGHGPFRGPPMNASIPISGSCSAD
ncbi:hypothetical protein ACIQ6Y_33285 [Streptomyces sp. NPDC096205]|uniref:hypothetical protein n=1 Tax=Streptomyces sp. NPDC096205 TaxID=3366081 RepID=UPI00382904B6